MTAIRFENQQLFIEQLSAKQIATQFGTPCYVYSKSAIENRWLAYQKAFGDYPHLICYAVKANSNIAILQLLAQLGSGFDIVSEGELVRVLQAGGDPKKIVFSGVGKEASEIARALEVGILCFNVESHQELSTIQAIAKEQHKKANVSIRVNPNINPRTHPYISTGLKENKFGIPLDEALEAYQFAQKQSHLSVKGIDCHIGSQLTEMEPFIEAMTQVMKLVDVLQKQGISIQHLDIGGGLGITYQNETPPEPSAYIFKMLETLKSIYKEKSLKLLIEPGRSIVGNAGVLLTEVLYTKETPDKNFAIVDAGMNDLMRPALYQAWQNIVSVESYSTHEKTWDIVGPVCESGDFLGKNRILSLMPHSLLAILSAGAYGFSMASNYNTRNRPAEILIDHDIAYQIRRRETFEDQTRLESLIPGPHA